MNAVRMRFRSTDQDETRAFVRGNYGEHSRVIHGKGGFLYAIDVVTTDHVGIGQSRRRLRQTLRAAVPHPTLFLDLHPGETIHYGRRSYELGPTCAILSAVGHEYTRSGFSPGCLMLRVDGGLLEREIAARAAPGPRRYLPQSVPIAMSTERTVELHTYLTEARAAADTGSWGHHGDAGGYERAVAGWVAALVLESAGVRSASDVGLDRVVRLQRWIDAHLDEAITLDRMCAVVRVGPRALQKALLATRGVTPLEYVTARRLDAVRKRLESGAPGLVVSQVALDCGFTHLGRFSAIYRRAFGESPSHTIARST
jgi:AraC-like DNA-binding protein